MTKISKILENLKLINYKFDEEANIIVSSTDDVHQVIELVNINSELEKNNIDYEVDKYNNILLTMDK